MEIRKEKLLESVLPCTTNQNILAQEAIFKKPRSEAIILEAEFNQEHFREGGITLYQEIKIQWKVSGQVQ